MSDLEGKVIESCIGTFKPEIISYHSDYKPVSSGNQQCPYCEVHGQDYILTDGHYVCHCRFCDIVWRWRLIRNEQFTKG